MITTPLPDRDRRHLLQFYLARKMDYSMRLFWAGLLILIGLCIQLFGPTSSTWITLILSLPLLAAGTLLLLVRGYNLRPSHSMRRGTWEKTTRDQFARLRTLEREVKRWDEASTDLTCVRGAISLFVVASGVGVTGLVLASSPSTHVWAPLFVADAAILLLPHWITGTRRGWRPLTLRQQIDALEIALAAIAKQATPSCQIQPMFEMAGKGECRMPINARIFVRFPDGPSDLLGMQLQVALNKVQGTSFPYLYAVIVAQPQLGLLDNYFPAIRQQWQTTKGPAKGLLGAVGKPKKTALTVESSKEKEVEVIVIRQKTSKTSGYHTTPAMVRKVTQAAWQSIEYILAQTPANPGIRD